MVKFRFEFIGIEYLYGTLLPPRADRLALSKIDLNMHHSMWEWFEFWVVIGGTVKDQIPRFEICFS